MATTPVLIDQLPQVVDIAMRRGDSVALAVQVWDDAEQTEPSDLTGAIVTAQTREVPDGPLIGDWTVEVTGNLIEMVFSAKLAVDLPRLAVWDCQIDWFADGMTVTTITAGSVSADPDVTHDG